MLLFPVQHSNIPQGPCEFAAEPWSTIVHRLGTTDTLPMIQTLFKSLFCWWGSWDPVRAPRRFVIIQESECMSAHSAIPDLFPPASWLIAFIANHHFLSPLCVFCNPPPPPKHTSTRTSMHTWVFSPLVQMIWSPLSSLPFPETALLQISAPDFTSWTLVPILISLSSKPQSVW